MPVQTAAFTRLKENIQFFFVPYTSLWSFYRDAMKNVPTNQSGLPNTMRAQSPFDSSPLSSELPSFSSFEIYKWFKYVSSKFADSDVNNVGGSHALRLTESARLLQSLGYGNFTTISKIYRDNEDKPTSLMFDGKTIDGVEAPNTDTGVRVSPFRLLAYHKIANDFYRYAKWEEYCAPSCNVDYLPQSAPQMDSYLGSAAFDSWTSRENTLNSYLFDMEYSRLPLDRFNGGLPKAQFGDESVVNLGSGGNVDVVGSISTAKDNVKVFHRLSLSNPTVTLAGDIADSSASVTYKSGIPSHNGLLSVSDKSVTGITGDVIADDSGSTSVVTSVTPHTISVSGADSSELSVIALRRATALQRYKEIQECNDTDFCSQIEAHFGVRPNNHGTKSKFLGGYSSVFDINPQINQNLAGDNVANIQATHTSSSGGKCSFKDSDDYGIVMGLYRLNTQLDYDDRG